MLTDADLVAATTIAAGLVLVWAPLFPALRTPESPRGIVDLELPFGAGRARRIVAAWERDRLLGAARRSVLLDAPFIAFYTCALAALAALAGRAVDTGDVLVYAAVAAGALDLLENAGLWRMLRGHFGAGVPVMTSLVSLAKWILLVVVLVDSIGLLVYAALPV